MNCVALMTTVSRKHRLALLITVALWFYPFLLAASFYVTWLVACAALGHQPRPSIDDPKYIGNWVDLPYSLTGFLVIGFPAAVIGGIVATGWFAVTRRFSRIVMLSLILSLMAVWVSTVAFLRWDPLRVIAWYAD